MNSLLGDIRYAVRRARKRLGFTSIAVLSLALGIGVNTAAFSLVNAILLRKAPFPGRDRVAEIYITRNGEVMGPFSYPDYQDLRERSRGVFSQLSLSRLSVVSRNMGDHVEMLTTELVNGDYFPLMGVRPYLGRLLGAQDDQAPGAHPVVVLSNSYWERAFAKDPDIVGKSIDLSGRSYTIIGVAPPAIEGLLPGLAPSIYASIQMANQLGPVARDELKQRGDHSDFLRARLADGQTFVAARTLLDRFLQDQKRNYPDEWSPRFGLGLYPMTQIAVNPLLDKVIIPAASVLMIVVGLVLIVACTNLASFLLAQARDRQREIAIRLAVGATRMSLIRQLLVESLALALVGGGLGLLLSQLSLRALLSAHLPIPLPIHLDIGVDQRVLAFVVLASASAGLLFGLLPAVQATRPNVIETIKNENAGAKPGRRFTMRSALVVAQTAASLLLLVTSALFLRSFAAQSNVDPGFGAAPAGVVWMAIPTDRYDETRRAVALSEIEKRVRAMPGVQHVGVTNNIFLNTLNDMSRAVNVDGFEPPKGERGFDIRCATADSGYLDAIGVRLVQGRTFSSLDQQGAAKVAIVNEAFAKKFWPKGDALNQTFRADTSVYRVIGVMQTTKVRSLGEAPQPFFLFAFTQSPSPDFHLVASSRAGMDASRLTTDMLRVLHDFDASLMIVQAKTMEQHVATMVLPARLGAVAFALFAGLALLLALIGVYGVVRYAVSRRMREVAIRLAIGARPAAVVQLLMGEGVRLVAIGSVIGLALGFLMSRGLGALLYGVPSFDPVTFIGAPALLIVTGVLAAFLPARRASAVDPASALRAE